MTPQCCRRPPRPGRPNFTDVPLPVPKRMPPSSTVFCTQRDATGTTTNKGEGNPAEPFHAATLGDFWMVRTPGYRWARLYQSSVTRLREEFGSCGLSLRQGFESNHVR